jgi:hypothetical protein
LLSPGRGGGSGPQHLTGSAESEATPGSWTVGFGLFEGSLGSLTGGGVTMAPFPLPGCPANPPGDAPVSNQDRKRKYSIPTSKPIRSYYKKAKGFTNKNSQNANETPRTVWYLQKLLTSAREFDLRVIP